jgi:hypothetical protein
MATTDEEDIPPQPVSVADMFGNVWEEVLETPERVAEVLTARRGGSLWPLLLIGVVWTALVVRRPVATVCGGLASAALAAWVGAKEVKR